MRRVYGVWCGSEREIPGVGVVDPGPVELPESIAAKFAEQGLFKRKTKRVKHVRPDHEYRSK